MKQYNEKLATWRNAKPSNDAGINNIQIPGKPDLLIWQNRYKEPTPYEKDLVNHLIQAFGSGATQLSELVEFFNTQGFHQESGAVWNEKSFQDEMQKLGY